MFFTVLLALALSIDSLGAGLSYGMQKIILPWYGVLIICCCSGTILAVSMSVGSLLQQFIPPSAVQLIGAVLLIGLGLCMLGKSVRDVAQEKNEDTLFQWSIHQLGIMVQILCEPHRADLDRSGIISTKEALWLGLALSLDSFGAGIGMALMGYSPFWTSLCTAMSACLFLCVGLYLGGHLGERLSYKKIKLMPGCLLILIGIFRMVL